jgi:hypothetical protein
VLLVVRFLLRAAAVRLLHRGLHRGRDRVGVEDDAALDVARGAADRLDQRGAVPEVALLVGIEDRDERDLGNVDALRAGG